MLGRTGEIWGVGCEAQAAVEAKDSRKMKLNVQLEQEYRSCLGGTVGLLEISPSLPTRAPSLPPSGWK